MKHYDPNRAPNPEVWLALDEQERLDLVETYHQTTRDKLPNIKMHACFHVIVESQIAERLDPVVRALARLMKEGLSRHEALHAIGTVVAEHLYAALTMQDEDFSRTAMAVYNAAVERLTVKEWRRRYGS